MIGSTRRGKDLAGRVAQKMEAGCVTDITDVELKDKDMVVHRYMLGGNTVTTEVIKTPKKILAVMPKAFTLGEKQSVDGNKAVDADIKAKGPKYTLVERKEKVGESVDLEDAQTLVCIGRGLDKKEDLPIIQGLARGPRRRDRVYDRCRMKYGGCLRTGRSDYPGRNANLTCVFLLEYGADPAYGRCSRFQDNRGDQ